MLYEINQRWTIHDILMSILTTDTAKGKDEVPVQKHKTNTGE